MRKIGIFLIIILTAFNFGLHGDKLHLFKSILKTTKSNVVQFGLKTELLTKNKDIIQDVNSIFNLNIENKISEYNISTNKLNAHVSIYKIDKIENLELEIKFRKGIEITENMSKLLNSDSFYFVMEKKSGENFDTNVIKTLLKDNGVKDLQSTNLDNVTSLTGYTGEYKSISIDGEKIDINLAISNYANNKDLLIGSPVLLTNY